LNRPDIIPVFQQVGGKRVPQGMTPCRFEDPCLDPGFLERFL
jgi:hypothetical protein